MTYDCTILLTKIRAIFHQSASVSWMSRITCLSFVLLAAVASFAPADPDTPASEALGKAQQQFKAQNWADARQTFGSVPRLDRSSLVPIITGDIPAVVRRTSRAAQRGVAATA